MKECTYDPVTEKEYIHENGSDFKIQQFCELNQYDPHEEEVIDFAFSLRDELINDIEDKDDIIRLKFIKWIEEKFLLVMKESMISNDIPIPKNLIGFKAFKYKYQTQEINYNPSEQNSSKPSKNKGGRPKDPKIAKLREQLDKDYYSYRKEYSLPKSLDLLEKEYPNWKRSTIIKYLK